MDPISPVFTGNIEELTLQNSNYRKVIYTGKLQLVLMKLSVGEEIGMEVHEDHDQFFRVEQGQAKAIVDGVEYILNDGGVLVVPAGANHNIINIGSNELKLYTIYAPAQHPAGTVQQVKPAND